MLHRFLSKKKKRQTSLQQELMCYHGDITNYSKWLNVNRFELIYIENCSNTLSRNCTDLKAAHQINLDFLELFFTWSRTGHASCPSPKANCTQSRAKRTHLTLDRSPVRSPFVLVSVSLGKGGPIPPGQAIASILLVPLQDRTPS